MKRTTTCALGTVFLLSSVKTFRVRWELSSGGPAASGIVRMSAKKIELASFFTPIISKTKSLFYHIDLGRFAFAIQFLWLLSHTQTIRFNLGRCERRRINYG